MNTAFSVTPVTNISATDNLPSHALANNGELLVVRSSNSGDTMNITILGALNGVTVSQTVALQGQLEVQLTQLMDVFYGGYLASSPAGTVTVLRAGTAAVGAMRVTSSTTGVSGTLVLGLTGHTISYNLGANSTANDIQQQGDNTGTDIPGASATTAEYIRKGLRAGDTAEGDLTGVYSSFGPGTLPNPLLAVEDIQSNVLVLKDRVACSRTLSYDWSFTAGAGVGGTIDMSTPTGGVDGAQLESLTTAGTVPGTTGSTSISTAFDTENLSTNTLPGSSTPTTDAIQIGDVNTGSKKVTIRIITGAASNITAKYQTSTDGVNWHDGAVAIPTINAGAGVIYVETTERCEWLRVVILTNLNSGDEALDLRAIY